MAEPQLSSSNGTVTAAVAQMSLEERRQQLVDLLRTKVEQGYIVESQTDTEAILISKGRRRRFGLGESRPDARQLVSIDGQGCASTRSL